MNTSCVNSTRVSTRTRKHTKYVPKRRSRRVTSIKTFSAGMFGSNSINTVLCFLNLLTQHVLL